MNFKLISKYKPAGDQPRAINQILENFKKYNRQVLLGVTGSGKTFTMANVIANLNLPTLIIAHNKTLAAQLFYEFKELFPYNAIEYFVSYYDYYQPEAYIPEKDLYIEKDSSINAQIEKLRYSATRSVLERRDVIVISSVSCIYGLGSPETYQGMIKTISVGEEVGRDEFIKYLITIQYERNDIGFKRNCFRTKGEIVEFFPPYEDEIAIRVIFWGDEIEDIESFNVLTGKVVGKYEKITVFPTSHYVAPEDKIKRAILSIEEELKVRVKELRAQGKLLEAQRLEQRTKFDLEQLAIAGFCKGIENYSRHLDGRLPGEPPCTLLDYFPDDYFVIIDESHQTIPQIRGMYNGDRSRKLTLVEHGFRLPSALDNRSLNFKEFEQKLNKVLYVSATPGDYEIKASKGIIVEQIIRPTGLLDPKPILKPAKNQIFDLYEEIKKEISNNNRVLVTVLTKKFAEDLTEFYKEKGLKVKYLHSEIDTIERTIIISELREGVFDVLIGINLLREGLDIPEISLVAITDADKEGFLRDYRSLIQIAGRAARNVEGRVIFYADRITDSLKKAISEIKRRRKIQEEYNKKHNIIPQSIKKNIHSLLESIYEKDYYNLPTIKKKKFKDDKELERYLFELQQKMIEAAKKMNFELAAKYRDELKNYMSIKGLVLDIDF